VIVKQPLLERAPCVGVMIAERIGASAALDERNEERTPWWERRVERGDEITRNVSRLGIDLAVDLECRDGAFRPAQTEDGELGIGAGEEGGLSLKEDRAGERAKDVAGETA
jgi:hypothetical protein